MEKRYTVVCYDGDMREVYVSDRYTYFSALDMFMAKCRLARSIDSEIMSVFMFDRNLDYGPGSICAKYLANYN